MRVKTEDRRNAIMSAAMSVFREVGYERASMTEISARVGGSKATLYGYFKSKEELFAAAMIGAMEERGEDFLRRLRQPGHDVARTLVDFGYAYLDFVLSPDVLAVTRAAVTEGRPSKLGPLLYEYGPRRAWREVGTCLAEFMDAGLLRKCDPAIPAAHLLGLLEAGTLEPALFGADSSFSRESAVKTAVDVFLRAYAEPHKPETVTDLSMSNIGQSATIR